MKKHIRIFRKHYNIGDQDVFTCQYPMCNQTNGEIHHIEPRGMGGSKTKDTIDNLIFLCRDHHNKAESKETSKEELKLIIKNICQYKI